MRNLSKISALALVMALSWTAAMAADAPAKKPWKEGWDRKQVKVFAYACTDGLLAPAVRDYNAAALADGITLHKPFPEQAFRDSAFPMCLCISERVAETWTVAEMGKQGLQRARPYIDEALAGGRCKPDGMLGDILKKQKAKM
jgi:hypothetical protein